MVDPEVAGYGLDAPAVEAQRDDCLPGLPNVLGFVVGWVVPDGQSETVREGYRETFNAFGFLSAWRQLCFAGFVSRSA